MNKVIRALKTWKTFGKALFLNFVPMEKRVAVQPDEEFTKNGSSKTSNGAQDVEVQFSCDMKLGDPGEPAIPAGPSGTGQGQRNMNETPQSYEPQRPRPAVLADTSRRTPSDALNDQSEFPRPPASPTPRNGSRRSEVDVPITILRPLAVTQSSLSQQSRATNITSQPCAQLKVPPPDYATSQRAAQGFLQRDTQYCSPPQASQHAQVREQGTISQIPGVQNTQTTTGLPNEAPQGGNFDMHGSCHGWTATGGVGQIDTGSSVFNTHGGVVNNYFQTTALSSSPRPCRANFRNGLAPGPDNHIPRATVENQFQGRAAGTVSIHHQQASCIVH
jgi:hypothetical protein